MTGPYRAGGYLPDPLPAAVLVGREREGRTLSVTTEPLHVHSRRLGLRFTIPAGYLTDWASIPQWAQVRIQPYGRHVWAALAHDWLYTVGEPGMRAAADALFLEKLEEAAVPALRRAVMFRAVRLGGGGGYSRAAAEWARSFADPRTGRAAAPPFERETAFFGKPNGPRAWRPGCASPATK